MILNKKPLAIAEIAPYIKENEKSEALLAYLKKFGKLSPEEARKMKKEIADLKNPKIREEHIVKLIDCLPKDHEETHKIFSDVSLSEEEINVLLDIVKKY